MLHQRPLDRRQFLAAQAAALTGFAVTRTAAAAAPAKPAQVAITLDLEMSRDYPRRGMTEWDYQKGSLDAATKEYSLKAADLVRSRGGVIHFFCVGRTLEQADVGWLKELAAAGHPIGNHTYDHVNVHATTPEATQFRFRRAPWLVAGKSADAVIRENVRLTSLALRERCGIEAAGFRTPGGSPAGLRERPDLQQLFLDLGFTWVSSVYPRHTSGIPKQQPTEAVYDAIVAAQQQSQPFVYPSGLVEVPMSPISDVTAFRSHYWKLDWYLEALRRVTTWAIGTRSVFDFLAHPSCLVVEDPHCESFELMLDLVGDAQGKAEVVSLDAVAAAVG